MTPTEIRSALEAHAAACREALSAMWPRPDMPQALRGANLRGADLSDANLSGANLSGANLRGANLSDANLPTGHRIASLCFGGWPVTVTPETTTIGCQTHPNEKWLSWQPDDVREMHSDAEAWWTRHREAVCAVIRDVMQPVAEEAGRRA